MDNNFALNRYIRDEYLSPIVSCHKINQQERQNLTKEFLSALNIADKRDKNSTQRQLFFLAALAKLFPGTF
ncbi:MAG TPA: hypothetical protein VLR89_00185 [Anaerolineaceae bacterium]|nr:hypothetical protein [Anaerolineaceae bacterium]